MHVPVCPNAFPCFFHSFLSLGFSIYTLSFICLSVCLVWSPICFSSLSVLFLCLFYFLISGYQWCCTGKRNSSRNRRICDKFDRQVSSAVCMVMLLLSVNNPAPVVYPVINPVFLILMQRFHNTVDCICCTYCIVICDVMCCVVLCCAVLCFVSFRFLDTLSCAALCFVELCCVALCCVACA